MYTTFKRFSLRFLLNVYLQVSKILKVVSRRFFISPPCLFKTFLKNTFCVVDSVNVFRWCSPPIAINSLTCWRPDQSHNYPS